MQEIFRPGTAISDASNLCTAVGGDQNKEFRGNASFLREKDPRGGIKIYCYWIFHIDQKAKNHMYSLYLDILTCFLLDCNYHINFCGGTGFVYVPPTVYSTQFAFIWVGRSCIQFLAPDKKKFNWQLIIKRNFCENTFHMW